MLWVITMVWLVQHAFRVELLKLCITLMDNQSSSCYYGISTTINRLILPSALAAESPAQGLIWVMMLRVEELI